MLNQVVIVGRVFDILEDNMIVKVPRSYKNENGEYDNDMIVCHIAGNVGTNVKEYCGKGDIIGVKGRIASIEDKMIIETEKVTFLSSSKKEED